MIAIIVMKITNPPSRSDGDQILTALGFVLVVIGCLAGALMAYATDGIWAALAGLVVGGILGGCVFVLDLVVAIILFAFAEKCKSWLE